MNHHSESLKHHADHLERHAVDWMARHGIVCTRISLGIIFLWFGGLKFFPGFSPAEGLAGQTLQAMSFGLVAPEIGVPLLGLWEVCIGVGFLLGRSLRLPLLCLFLHMIGTTMPFFLLPDVVFTQDPVSLTIEGQYIIKNVVIIAAGMVIGGTVRGRQLGTWPPLPGERIPAG